jgi:hypothetical protein
MSVSGAIRLDLAINSPSSAGLAVERNNLAYDWLCH